MDNFDLRKYLAEGKLLKEDLIDKIKKLKDYNKTEDSLKYKKYDITYDKDENLYSVFLKKGSGDSSDMPEFESSSPEKVKKYLAEGRLLKEEIMVDTTVMVDPNNTLMSNASDEEIDYIKDNITSVPKMPVEDFIDIYDEYLDRFYDEADPLDLQIKALQIHIDKGALTREEAIEALAMLQGQDVEEFEDEFLAEGKLLKEESAGVFIGWADDMLGMEEPTFPKGTELKLRSKADAGKTSLTYYFQLADKKGDGNLQMYITVGDEPSIKYRANNLDDNKVKAYIDKRKDDFVSYFDFVAQNNSKEEMGKKYHVGSGYEDKVTDEDVASIKDGIKKLKSLKIETF